MSGLETPLRRQRKEWQGRRRSPGSGKHLCVGREKSQRLQSVRTMMETPLRRQRKELRKKRIDRELRNTSA